MVDEKARYERYLWRAGFWRAIRLDRLAAGLFVWLCLISVSAGQSGTWEDWTRLSEKWKENESKAESIRIEFSLIQVNRTRKTGDQDAVVGSPFEHIPIKIANRSIRYECLFLADGKKFRFEKTGLFWNSAKRRYEKGKRTIVWNGSQGVGILEMSDASPHPFTYTDAPRVFTLMPIYYAVRWGEPAWEEDFRDELELTKSGDSIILSGQTRKHAAILWCNYLISNTQQSLITKASFGKNRQKEPSAAIEVEYQEDASAGLWLPRSWEVFGKLQPFERELARLRKYTINPDLDESLFDYSPREETRP